jgi:hypothetical protein
LNHKPPQSEAERGQRDRKTRGTRKMRKGFLGASIQYPGGKTLMIIIRDLILLIPGF